MHQILMIFAQMLESDLASELCRKFSFDPQGGFTRRRETSALRACYFYRSFWSPAERLGLMV